jgi:hypothetical protein
MIALAIISLTLSACVQPPTPPPPSPSPLKDCVDFEDLTVGTTYQVPATFADSGAMVWVLPFQWSNMNWTSIGRADAVKVGLAGGSGNEMFLNNVNLGLDIGALECVNLKFRDRGGNVNLIMNDKVGNSNDFQNTNLGGVTVSADTHYEHGDLVGTLKLSGKFAKFNFQEKQWISFAIGGQELSIDDVCPCH